MTHSTEISSKRDLRLQESVAARPASSAGPERANDAAPASINEEESQEESEGNAAAGAPAPARLAMVESTELTALAHKYGEPQRIVYTMQADAYIHAYRWRRDSDRRAEVVFAIEDPSGQVWVHAKPHYPANIFRLPSGGICWDEGIEAGLLREVQEETGLTVRIERFLGLLEYTFYYAGTTAEFASYVFHLQSAGGKPVPAEGETICAFRPIPPGQISEVAVELRNLMGDRRGWGQWRALAHDLVYTSLTQPRSPRTPRPARANRISNQPLSSKGSFAC